MANWKKVIVSGSNAELNDIFASGNITGSNISSSGELYFNSSEGNYTDLVVVDTSTGKLYRTASSAIQSDTTDIEADITQLQASASAGIRFEDSDSGFSTSLIGTASFDASGTGLSVNVASDTITYTVDPDTLVGGVTSTNTFNFTASNAVTASYVNGTADVATQVTLTDEENTNADRAIVFANPATGTSTLLTDNSTFRYNSAEAKVMIGSGSNIISIDGSNNIVQEGTNTTANILNTVVTTMDIGGAATTINMGAAAGTVNIAGSASIAGDLIVQGTTTTLNTENLLVEDKYILLASSSAANSVGGGIVVQRGSTTSGTALHWDEVKDVWALDVANANASTGTAKALDANIAFVSHSAGLPGANYDAAVIVGVDDDYKKGQFYVDTSDDYGLYVYL